MRLRLPSPTPLLSAAAAALLLLAPTPTHALSDAQKLVAEAWRVVDQSYVDRTFNNHDWFAVRMKAVKKQTYASIPDAYVAIRSMLALLEDPYTRFLTPQQLDSLTSSTTGELAGVGVEMYPARRADNLQVTAPLKQSPAARAGVLPNDVIRFIDGESVDSLTPDEAAARIRGQPGTTISLTVVHDAGRGKEETFNLVRETLKLQSVSVDRLSGGTLHLRIKLFTSTTADDTATALRANAPVSRVVLDLRNNPGGYFPGGVDVARLFMHRESPIVFVVDKNGIQDEMDAITEGAFADVPLIVLVNGATASASEILAGALKDSGRAKLVGEQTFGKGVVQTVSPLSDGSGVAVTIARYETPAHKDINKIGIAPDLIAACDIDAEIRSCIPSELW